MLTGYGDDQALLGAIVAGAAGYVSKQTCGTDLVSALRKVASGLSVLDPQASGLVMAKLRQRSASVDPVAALTEQEKRVLELIGEGLTNRQIASGCSWPRRRRRITCLRCSPSLACSGARRRRRSPCGTRIAHDEVNHLGRLRSVPIGAAGPA